MIVSTMNFRAKNYELFCKFDIQNFSKIMAFLLIKYYSQFRFFFLFFLKIVDISMKTSFQKVEQCASKWNKEVS